MAEQSGFFNANLINGTYDRTYLAESFAKYFASFVGNGVFAGKLSELMVTQTLNPGMKVEVLPGLGYINGYWYENTSNLSLNIEAADGVLNRIDCIVLRWSKSDRSINAVVKKGSFASSPIAPSLQRDADIYELKIAEIYINAGTVNITQANIVDTRYDSAACGLVSSLIEQIDVTELSGLLNAAINEVEIKTKNEIESISKRLNLIAKDESALASLALAIDDVENNTALSSQTLGYFKKNMIPYPYVHKSRVANGITWTDVGDGTIKANGTATSGSYFNLYAGKPFAPGKYIISSNMDEKNRYFIYASFTDKITSENFSIGNGYDDIEIEITKEDVEKYNLFINLYVTTGTSVSNVIFKPMLRRAEILNGDWEPFKLSFGEMIQEDVIEKGCFYRVNRFTGIKEWLNAPNTPGIEYCLTERWNNKPVYQKTLYAASLPNNSIVGIEVDSAYTAIVSIDGYALDTDNNYYHVFPVIVSGVTPIAVIAGFEGDGGNGGTVVIRTNADATNYQAYITVKYTKT